MNGTLSKFFIFTVGAAVGSLVTWKLIKTRYEQIAQEEIDSVKEVYSRRSDISEDFEECVEKDEDVESDDAPSDIREYATRLAKAGYTDYSKIEDDKGVSNVVKPYVIPPDNFGELDDYETISLTYYADGILADDMDEPVENIDDVIGLESLNHFGEYEDDSVFVRNDEMKVDYEILADSRKYSNVANKSPQHAEDE